MGRGDGGDSARLLGRLSRGPGRGPRGWSDGDGPERVLPVEHPDPLPAGARGDGQGRRGERGRHVDISPVAPGAGWRVSGVPPGLAVILLLGAVLAVVLLGRAGGSEEVLVGPSGVVGDGDAVVDEAPTGDVPDRGVPGDGAPVTEVPVGDSPVGGVSVGEDVAGEVAAGGAGEPPPAAGGPLLVHVDGAVRSPGVVQLPAAARVGDAVQAAGGATEDADTRLVNLARPLADGELVVVPRTGEQVAAPHGAAGPPVAGGAAAPGTPGGDAQAPGALVNLNTADATALDALPGIGPVLAERIVTWRTDSGPFAGVDDLTSVSGIGPAVMADIRDLVTV